MNVRAVQPPAASAPVHLTGGAVAIRPVALVTGAGRRAGIAAALVIGLAGSGWDVAFTYLRAYDDRMPWGGRDEAAAPDLLARVEAAGGRALALEVDPADPEAPAQVFDRVEESLGPVTARVMCHCESVDSAILDTMVESFDRHFAVNARAVWQLVREYALRHAIPFGAGRILAFTSDHTAFNLPYGASKAALAHLGVTANVINPGPIDTGWMSAGTRDETVAATPLGRLGTPQDCANLVTLLCSPEGGWINGQLLYSNGGFSPG